MPVEKELEYLKGTIEHPQQPEGGRGISEYEKCLLFDRGELEGKSVLDLGAGPELKFARDLYNLDISADVTSLSPDFNDLKILERAQKAFPEGKTVAGVAQNLPFENESFDRIFALNVVEHFSGEEMLQKSLVEASRVLKKGGKAIFGPIPYFYSADYDDILADENLQGFFKEHGVTASTNSISKENLFKERMRAGGDNLGPIIYKDVTFFNIVLEK